MPPNLSAWTFRGERGAGLRLGRATLSGKPECPHYGDTRIERSHNGDTHCWHLNVPIMETLELAGELGLPRLQAPTTPAPGESTTQEEGGRAGSMGCQTSFDTETGLTLHNSSSMPAPGKSTAREEGGHTGCRGCQTNFGTKRGLTLHSSNSTTHATHQWTFKAIGNYNIQSYEKATEIRLRIC